MRSKVDVDWIIWDQERKMKIVTLKKKNGGIVI